MDRLELAWAAGFWDGEGSAWLTRAEGRRSWQPQARINQSSTTGVPEALLRFKDAVGVGAIKGPELDAGRAPLYRWVVSSRRDVLQTYDELRPWLGPVKRRQFTRVLDLVPEPHPPTGAVERTERLAWAAGLFDGEGSVYAAKHRSHPGYHTLEAAITQSSRDGPPKVLTEFGDLVGVGKIGGPYPAPEGHEPVYRWKAHRADEIVAMIEALLPHLGRVKREQADSAIAMVRSQPVLPLGNPSWGSHKTHCVNGHEYAAARIKSFRSRGKNAGPRRASKQCLACVREHARRKRLERRARSG